MVEERRAEQRWPLSCAKIGDCPYYLHTCLVVEPTGNPGAEARLWVYLHGRGVGYFDEQGVYHATWNQNRDRWNHEETFEDLRKTDPTHPFRHDQ